MVLTMVELTLVDIGGDTNDGEGEDNILRILELCGTGPWFIEDNICRRPWVVHLFMPRRVRLIFLNPPSLSNSKERLMDFG